MYLTAETVTIDSDEGRFTLEIVDDEGDRHSFIIHHIDLDAFYDQVKGRIGPYLRERDEAQLTYIKEGIDQDLERYGHVAGWRDPRYHSLHADLYDNREGK